MLPFTKDLGSDLSNSNPKLNHQGNYKISDPVYQWLGNIFPCASSLLCLSQIKSSSAAVLCGLDTYWFGAAGSLVVRVLD